MRISNNGYWRRNMITWTKNDIVILKKEYPNGDSKNIELLLKRKFHTIISKASRLGIKRKIIKNLGSRNSMWKGDKVGYNALHSWVRTRKVKPELCETCGKKPPYDLSNISGEYKRNVNDFKYECRVCHMKNDGRLKKFNENKKRRNVKGMLYECSNCKKFKDKNSFRKDKYRVDKITSNCKDCLKRVSKLYYKKCSICKIKFETIYPNQKVCSNNNCNGILYKSSQKKCQKKLYDLRKEKSLCIRCGKYNNTQHNMCKDCNEKYNKQDRKRWKNATM